jgi:hypothetical protein
MQTFFNMKQQKRMTIFSFANQLRAGLLILWVITVIGLNAQAPAGMNFQAIAKDLQGNPAKSRTINVKGTILQGFAVGGKSVWEETFEVVTNQDGVFSIQIGKGTKLPSVSINNIGQIDWGNGPYFFNFKVAVAPSIPTTWWVPEDNYQDMGTSQLMSVPYALFAANANVTNVNTGIKPGPPNTFLVTDSSGNVNWRTPQAAQQSVTTVTNFVMNLAVSSGENVSIPPNTTAVVTVSVKGVQKGDPILVTPQDDYKQWSIYSSWVSGPDQVSIRFANYTDQPVAVLGSQYKIVVIK